MHRLLPVFILLLASCAQFKTTPEPPPPAGATAQEITHARSMTLTRTGAVSVTEPGSPDDAERAIAVKATEAGAKWYVIQLVSETAMPGIWYARALLYGPATSTSTQQ